MSPRGGRRPGAGRKYIGHEYKHSVMIRVTTLDVDKPDEELRLALDTLTPEERREALLQYAREKQAKESEAENGSS